MLNNKVLLNKCNNPVLGEYYDLPGGGQRQFETMEDALKRECLEETGFSVIPISFLALCEEIYHDAYLREIYPDYTHRIFHIFLCRIEDKKAAAPTETDWSQTGSEWIDIEAVQDINLYPLSLRKNLSSLLSGNAPRYLGYDILTRREFEDIAP